MRFRGLAVDAFFAGLCAALVFSVAGCDGCTVDPTHEDQSVRCDETADCVERFGEDFECRGDPGMCVRVEVPDEPCEDDSDCDDGVCEDGVCLACRDGDARPCGTDVGECEFGTETCVDGDWGVCEGGVGPTAEVCDGRDNDCNGTADDIDPALAPPADRQQGVCEGARKVCAGEDGWLEPDYSQIEGYEDVEVTCDGLDNDCSGTVDDFDPALAPLADKQEGVCEGARKVCAGTDGWLEPDYTLMDHYEANEISCDGRDNDCNGTADDIDPALAPLADVQEGICEGARKLCFESEWIEPDYTALSGWSPVEICTDGVDNTCDGLVDLEDSTACPAISVDIMSWADPVDISHGRQTNIFASISPDDETPPAWTREWQIVQARGDQCDPDDVTLSGQEDQPAASRITATMPDVIEKQDCIYVLEVTVNGYARDSVRLRMVNRLPDVTIVGGSHHDGVWYMHLPAGSTPSVTAGATDLDNDSPIHFDWSGADAGLLACAPDCASSDGTPPHQATVTFDAPLSPGTFELVAEARDGFDPEPGTAVVILEVDACVWVSEGGSGDGSAPDSALPSIQDALDQASMVSGAAACVVGTGTFAENLVFPAAPNAPNLIGGFDVAGAPSAARPQVDLTSFDGITFEPGYDGILRRLRLRQQLSLPIELPSAIVTIQGSSPRLFDIIMNLGSGSPPAGVRIHGGNSDTAPTEPVIVGSYINGSGGHHPAGLVVSVEPGGSVNPWITSTNISVIGDGVARGVHVLPGAQVRVGEDAQVHANSRTGDAIGIDIEGSNAATATALIERTGFVHAGAGGDTAVSIRLWRTEGVVIRDNAMVGSVFSRAGRLLGAGIADGFVRRDGSVVSGGSSDLIIEGNRWITGGGSQWVTGCEAGGLGEGADVTAGILLVGTSDVLIAGNGKGDLDSGVFGGSSAVHWNATTRRLPPSSIGLWLVATENVLVEDNELRSGSYQTLASCPVPVEVPPGVAYRDGLPPNEHTGASGAYPSSGTVFDRNGASCAQPLQAGGDLAAVPSWCVVAEINAPDPIIGAPRLTNNYLAATRGNYLIALRQRGGAGLTAANNTFDSDLMLRPWEPEPPPASIVKWPVLLEKIEPAGVELVNNIIYAHRDDPFDAPTERLCVREKVDAGTNSRIGTLRNNLFHIEAGAVVFSGEALVRVTDGLMFSNFSALQLNAISGVVDIGGNFEAAPGLTEPAEDWRKSTSRLLPGSAAIDAGLPVGGIVPAHDMDDEARPGPSGLVDIGHDEHYP